MRSYETQEKNIRTARGYAACEVSQAISESHYSKADKDTMLHIINATFNRSAMRTYDEADTMVREVLQDIIEETYYGKKKATESKCPVCGKLYSERPALSRDGKTAICPDCGMQEAIAAYVQSVMAEDKMTV